MVIETNMVVNHHIGFREDEAVNALRFEDGEEIFHPWHCHMDFLSLTWRG